MGQRLIAVSLLIIFSMPVTKDLAYCAGVINEALSPSKIAWLSKQICG